MERCQWRHRQELAELKHNTDLMVMEIRASMEAEKQRALLDFKHKHEIEKEQAVQETKRKQWCAFCLKEAQLYCCWNTAYCSYNCQQSHWLPHMNSCLNKQHQDNNNPDILPRGVVPRPAYNLSPGQVGYLISP
uniref:MYND-type domain-containing protein n=1 Tax=Graphocephala atropunctata TaxID=36148 RepID=A0A1B6M9C3_9HEMI